MSDEQLEYSKQLYAEGEKAMKDKDFTTALTKYKEAYRYAPHLHLFTYNIAVAAEAAGDCKTAQTYYVMFLDLVMEHPELGKAEKKVEQLRAECPFDQETEEVVSSQSREDRARERVALEKARAMNGALQELTAAERLYKASAERFTQTKAFKRTASRKRRHARRMKKLLTSHEVEADLSDPPPVELAGDAAQACRQARTQEKRLIRALEEVRDAYDTNESYRVVSRFLRAAETRDLPAFEGCA